jgi:hypothetical protein
VYRLRRDVHNQSSLPIELGNYCSLSACGGDELCLPVQFFQWQPECRFWKATRNVNGQTKERTVCAVGSDCRTDFRDWRLLIYALRSNVSRLSDQLRKDLGGQEKIRCDIHRQFLVKQTMSCSVPCCVKDCVRTARWLCLGKGETCCNAVCWAHGKDILHRSDIVNVQMEMQ